MINQSYENSDRKMTDRELIKKTWVYIKPYKAKFLLAMFLMVLMIITDLIGPIFIQEIILKLQMDVIDLSSIFGLVAI